VALVIVADPVPEVAAPSNKVIGITSVPPSVPPEVVMVKGVLTVVPPPASAVSGIVALNVPLPEIPPVSVAVPVAVKAVPDTAKLAFTVSVSLEVAASAAAPITNNVVRTRSICILLDGTPEKAPQRIAHAPVHSGRDPPGVSASP
jgi:hypothetical protein